MSSPKNNATKTRGPFFSWLTCIKMVVCPISVSSSLQLHIQFFFSNARWVAVRKESRVPHHPELFFLDGLPPINPTNHPSCTCNWKWMSSPHINTRKESFHPSLSNRISFGFQSLISKWVSLPTYGVYWGYSPLILTIDPNFQPDIHCHPDFIPARCQYSES